ncbi:CCHC-type domain-containing protein [Trichonephila inaurata madagascariensis]|uniref:CCHC-type domain-containing protein n=1 Tax=Trichonephila inaurata madagascariensis TaxID=2747483 RepID=A0A8X7C3P4_9ARAC|nr:CCHC-type domain-containing protein [Trichonephila inaurata madagascariensis]
MLATELGLAPSDNLKIIELKDLITNNDRYDEEFVKDVLSVIVEERTATEKQKAAELEEKQKAVVVAQQREREFELEKMKIQLEMQKLSQAPVTSQQKVNLLEDPVVTTHLDPLELYLDSKVTKLKEETPYTQCYRCGTPGVVKSKCGIIQLEFRLVSLKCEKLFKFLQEHDVTFTNKRISFMMADRIRQTIMALSTVIDLLYIEGKVIPTEFLVLPEAKGNRTLLGLDFFNASGIVLDVSTEGTELEDRTVAARVDLLGKVIPWRAIEDKLSKLVKTSISVDGKLVHALVDSGTEITVIKKDLVPGISVEVASTIYLKGIFGPGVKCPLVYVPIGLATGGQSEENSLAQSSQDLRVDSGNVDETEVSSGILPEKAQENVEDGQKNITSCWNEVGTFGTKDEEVTAEMDKGSMLAHSFRSEQECCADLALA